MKTLIILALAGALPAISAFAGSIPQDDVGAKKSAPQLPFRPYQKRPVGTATRSAATPATVATPKLPFRPVQKRPSSPANSSKPEMSSSLK
jgi:hypothetical protein